MPKNSASDVQSERLTTTFSAQNFKIEQKYLQRLYTFCPCSFIVTFIFRVIKRHGIKKDKLDIRKVLMKK